MDDINSVTLTGRLTRDAGTKFTPSGACLVSFSIASNYSVKVGDDWQNKAEFTDVQWWGKLAEACAPSLVKGLPVSVEGSKRTDSWESDGAKKSRVYVKAESVVFSGAKKDAKQEAPIKLKMSDSESQAAFENDIPF